MAADSVIQTGIKNSGAGWWVRRNNVLRCLNPACESG